eukprot:CAMPEP_0114612354 /NCGR_PEP_ID=MMETSP0168-20121206/4579_1 /TAXON_ID=95228 ORGANISM="Vannella sp., Strain DIVA3 517/6/12" /NCGR_SAMPLE_ID=MMETSP0168 /ASSEMBLY_ACC=CAM_ASM_000044 /LENGTH=322 /DNA_ID=CAMNT_0001823337 /DNA_START=173 /DNA_END=1138 /DNA_ORIENTATION=-
MEAGTPAGEIYEYRAPWPVYGMNWSNTDPFRLAVASFKEDYSNAVQVVQFDGAQDAFVEQGRAEHPYPATKLMWAPAAAAAPSLLATSGDYLRLWAVSDDGLQQTECLNNNKSSEFCAPLTSFDWNEADASMLGTASIDTTCTIWDVATQQVRTQLIAHDKEVYDMAFAPGRHVFASCGADGSVRTFDLRKLEHSTIIYEAPDFSPLLRVAWNKQDDNYLAVVCMDSAKAVVLDRRVPSLPAAEIHGQLSGGVNSLAWAPHSSCHLCTAGDDRQALIWDLSRLPQRVEEPILAYNAGAEVNQLQWSALQPSWIAIALQSSVQ